MTVFMKQCHSSVRVHGLLGQCCSVSRGESSRLLSIQALLKDPTAGLLSLRHGWAGPCELSNQGSRRLRTCGRSSADGVGGVDSELEPRCSRG